GDLVRIADAGLDLLQAHHRADATTGRQARGPPVLVAEGDARQQALVLADGAAQRDGHLLAVVLVEHRLGFEVALAEVWRRVVELDTAVLLDRKSTRLNSSH